MCSPAAATKAVNGPCVKQFIKPQMNGEPHQTKGREEQAGGVALPHELLGWAKLSGQQPHACYH